MVGNREPRRDQPGEALDPVVAADDALALEYFWQLSRIRKCRPPDRDVAHRAARHPLDLAHPQQVERELFLTRGGA